MLPKNWSCSIPLLLDNNVIASECIAGWWYGIIGHLEACDRNNNHCHCHYSGEKIILDSVVVIKVFFIFFILLCLCYRVYVY